MNEIGMDTFVVIGDVVQNYLQDEGYEIPRGVVDEAVSSALGLAGVDHPRRRKRVPPARQPVPQEDSWFQGRPNTTLVVTFTNIDSTGEYITMEFPAGHPTITTVRRAIAEPWLGADDESET